MKEKLLNQVILNTKNEEYKKSNAQDLGKSLGLSRNWVSQFLNEFYNDGIFIKINTCPVCFIEKNVFSKKMGVSIEKNLYASFDELFEDFKKVQKKDFQKLIGHQGSLSDVVDKCKASVSYPPFWLPTLFHGPTGTGKSTIVKLMYEYGVEKKIINPNARFVHVNCSEYVNNPELITANLFGYKKDAFTGADQDNLGLIQAANGGFLF